MENDSGRGVKKLLAQTTVILPALNEEEGIAGVIKKCKALGVREIIVVDGRSKDKTVQIAKKLGCRVIEQEGKGKGMAFQTFLKKGLSKKSAYYAMIDADSSYDAEDIPRAVRALANGLGVVSGTRTTIRYNPRDFAHFLGNKLISFIGFALFGKLNPDICTGLWAFGRGGLEQMKITAKGFDLEADIYAQACKKNIPTGTIEIEYRPRVGKGKLRTIDAMGIIGRLFAERFYK